MWYQFKIFGFDVAAKVYELPSKFGIDAGRISKLDISKWNIGLLQYDREWVYNYLPMSFVRMICSAIEHLV